MTREELVKAIEEKIKMFDFSNLMFEDEVNRVANNIVDEKCKCLDIESVVRISKFNEISNSKDELHNTTYYMSISLLLKDVIHYSFSYNIKVVVNKKVDLKPIFVEAIEKYNNFACEEIYGTYGVYDTIYEKVHIKDYENDLIDLFTVLENLRDNVINTMRECHHLWGKDNMVNFNYYVDILTPILKSLDIINTSRYSKDAIKEENTKEV